ncbi:MAG: flagellar hook-associated protein FlgL [Acidimicrobiales bacterium]
MLPRVTDLQMSTHRATWIESARTRLASAEETIATGRRINRASDDPTATAEVLRHERRLGRLDQLERNAGNARVWLDAADKTLQAADANLARAKTLTVQAANDTLEADERSAIAAELRALADQLLSQANTRVSGRAIFAGSADTDDAFAADGTYLGDAGVVRRSIEQSQTVDVSQPGTTAFGVANGADPLNGNVFQMLREVADRVETGTTADIRAGMGAIDTAAARMGTETGRVGAVQRHVDTVLQSQTDERLNVSARVSELRDADLAEAIIQLRTAEAGYDATMQSTARAMSRSLLDFLR